MITERRGLPKKAWLAFALLVILPLYGLAVVVAVRTGVFHVGSRAPLSSTAVTAVWAFLAAGLGTTATVAGLLLTHAEQGRNFRFQQELEQRKELAEAETDKRLRLDSATSMLALLSANGAYPTKAAVAGAISALVHLDHPVIAMRCLEAAWDDRAVDRATAAWLISEVYEKGTPESQFEAATLLESHSGLLTNPNKPSDFAWPACLDRVWPPVMSTEARASVVSAALEVLVSQHRSWWTDGWDWLITFLDEVVTKDQLPELSAAAADALLALTLESDQSESIEFAAEWRTIADMRARAQLAAAQTSERIFAVQVVRDRLTRWLRGEGESQGKSSVRTGAEPETDDQPGL